MAPTTDEPPRFVVDHMLGRLVTWLRVLGCDTVFAHRLDDAQIARLAQRENRIVLTRDRELARRTSIRTLLITGDQVDDQLAQVVAAWQLMPPRWPPRCSVCNDILVDLPRNEAQSLVPPHVFRTQSRFYRCQGCLRVYWQGTHWERMQERLQAAQAAGQTGRQGSPPVPEPGTRD